MPARSYSATGDLEGAKQVLQDMAAAGCQPNVKTYTELMSQLAAKGGLWMGVGCWARLWTMAVRRVNVSRGQGC